MLNRKFYEGRRAAFAALLPDNCVALELSGDERLATCDEYYPFEPFRNYMYLVGQDSPDQILMMVKKGGVVTEYLFIPRRTPKQILYEGKKPDLDTLPELTGIENVEYLDRFRPTLARLMFDGTMEDIYIDLGKWDAFHQDDPVQRLSEELLKVYPFAKFHNCHAMVAGLRPFKEPEEIEAHRKAAAITTEAINNMLANIRPGMRESHIEGYYDLILRKYGAGHAFATIAASGEHALTLHYGDNCDIAKDGDLILFDLGASYEYYCTDVSRTYPVNGKFTERQRQLYQVVLDGLNAAIKASVPGAVKNDLQEISRQVMAEELIKLGKIKNREEMKQYDKHGSGHLIGLNTHDEGDASDLLLVPGMMFTLEPGLYFEDEGIGIRIEETLLVTEDGVDVLTAGIPKEVDEIEAFMAAHK